ncbi:MAG TPA: glycosyltransferase family 4 protein [Longimicrobiaceae bacterium]|nr:glycosyltransferase family 4 protein [Longimicrobiaceae bacterium]
MAPNRPRLLFLAQTLPYPPDSGVAIRTLNVLRLLAREFDVTALCFYRRAVRPTAAQVRESLAALGALARVEAFPIPQEHSAPRLLRDHLASLLRGRVYTVAAYDSAGFRARLRELLREGRFDLAHVDSLDLSGYLDEIPAAVPVVCAHHNVESRLLERRAGAEPSLARRAYLRHQARLMLREERRWCPRVALNTAVSREDRDVFERAVPGARFTVVPNGVDTREIRPAAEDAPQEGLAFAGGYGWFPNRDALAHFCADVLPRLRDSGCDPPVRWVGEAPEQVRREYRERHGVELTGYVPDVRPHVQGAACYVVPLRVGGGTRLKILEAWAMGKAVVSTAVGCEGLDARDGENILVRDDPGEFAAAVRRVLDDASLRRRLGEAARRTAVEVYDWDVIGVEMVGEYAALAGAPGAREPVRRMAFLR